MSSSTSRVDRDGDGSDQRNLTDGEVTGDSEVTNTITTPRRIDWRH